VNDFNRSIRPSAHEVENIDELLAGVRKRIVLVILMTVLCTAVMIFLAFWLTPIYRGAAVLAPAHSDKNGMGEEGLGSLGSSVEGFAALAGLGMNDDSATDEALAVLKSQELTQTFIEENNLMPELFPGLWDGHTGTWRAGIKKIPTIARGYHTFDKIRKIERDPKSGLITLSIDWKDRIKAAEWTNRLVQLLNDEMRHRAIVQADASVGYLQKEYGSVPDVSTREAISRLMERQIKQQMLAHVTQEYALRVINKAISPDADSPVRPNKVLYAALGLFFGALLGTGLALVLQKRELAARHRDFSSGERGADSLPLAQVR
jgi:uncharacterized protein involved in exopolysaccharide biosynthesis